jgi:outer membrane immunogenic protein
MITKTKLLLLGTVFTLGATAMLADNALAADLPRKAPVAAPMYPPPVATWAGCYVGGAVGAVNHRMSGNFTDFEGSPGAFNFDKTGAIYGGYLGCNWQNRAFVYGIEGDFSGLSRTGASQIGPFDTDMGFSSKAQWLSTIRGRAGLAVDNAMVYLTGGLAIAEIKTSVFDCCGTGTSATNTMTGWTVGAGVEYMFTPNWIGRLEFLYADLGNKGTTLIGDGTPYTSNISHELMLGRVGLAYKW